LHQLKSLKILVPEQCIKPDLSSLAHV